MVYGGVFLQFMVDVGEGEVGLVVGIVFKEVVVDGAQDEDEDGEGQECEEESLGWVCAWCGGGGLEGVIGEGESV